MSPLLKLIIFLLVIVIGVGIEIILSKIYFRSHGKHQVVHFKLSRYFFLFLTPFLGVVLMSYIADSSVWKFFFIFMILGTILEYCVGYSYQKVVGQRLWKYNKYSLGGHTSLLAVPLWGLCGVLVYLLVNAFR